MTTEPDNEPDIFELKRETLATERNALISLSKRAEGMTYQQIADEMGCSPSTAHYRVRKGLRLAAFEPAAQVRELELQRLDHLMTIALAAAAENVPLMAGSNRVTDSSRVQVRDWRPNLLAVESLIHIQERRAKLLGLDLPVRVEVVAPADVVEGVGPDVIAGEVVPGVVEHVPFDGDYAAMARRIEHVRSPDAE